MRNTGKTKAMVEALPETGGIVCVSSQGMVRYVKQMIRDLRGDVVADKCHVIEMSKPTHTDRLRGIPPLGAYVNHNVYDVADPETVAMLGEFKRIGTIAT